MTWAFPGVSAGLNAVKGPEMLSDPLDVASLLLFFCVAVQHKTPFLQILVL